MDIYTIPQPVPVDITYSVKIICNRMRELNKLNQIILEKFASRQSYAVIKGHYIPIVMNGITDESVFDVEKRKYYIQTYDFTMLGFLIDEDEFEVSPAITRVLQVVEFEKKTTRRNKKKPIEEGPGSQALFLVDNTTLTQVFNYVVDIKIGETTNVYSFDVYINDDYYGSDLDLIQINSGDVLRLEIVKNNELIESTIQFIDKIF
jgi:hypothetical protein